MKKVELEGREVRFWDFDKPATIEVEENGKAIKKPVLDSKGNPVLGDWDYKNAIATAEIPEGPEDLNEIGTEKVLEYVRKGIEAEAKEAAKAAPEGTFSKGMVAQAVAALRLNPRFKDLKRAELSKAVMRYVGSNEKVKAGFMAAFEDYRTSDEEGEEENGGE